jgi:hypothetical protein
MRVYEFTAPHHQIVLAARFLGFVNYDTKQYLWVQRDECSEDETIPEAGNVWIELDDEQWSDYGGIARVELSRDALSIRLTPESAAYMSGVDEFRVRLALSDEEFARVREQLLRVFVGYEELVRVPAHPLGRADRQSG